MTILKLASHARCFEKLPLKRLGWSFKDKEIFTLEEDKQHFSLEYVKLHLQN